MKRIELANGQFAYVDDQDYERVSQHRWWVTRSGKNEYAITQVGRTSLAMHRLILEARPGQVVDHINRDGLDNRRQNLRVCTQQENLRNQGSRSRCSRFKGVARVVGSKTGKWAAKLRIDGKTRHLGTFDTEEQAARAYDKAAREIHGQFAYLNFPDPVAECRALHPLARGAA